jgi:two-component system NtrC family sensor kinase
MRITLRSKFTFSFLVVIAVCGIVSTWIGVRLIGDRVVQQAQDKVRVDLNTAREIYQKNLEHIKDVVRLTANRFFIKEAFFTGNMELLKAELERVRKQESLDMLTITDNIGHILFRSRHPSVLGNSQSEDQLVSRALFNKEVAASTQLISRKELLKEGEDLARRAHIIFVPTPRAKPKAVTGETSGMMMKAAAPITAPSGELLGVLYGGILLNRRYEIVDKIKETVYQGEIYKGKDIGTATIFQGDLRISTNVRRQDGSRAIGTRVSEEVFDQVLVKGLVWIERAFVVNDWYITAYEPIRDIENNIVGILYVGMLEEKFTDMKKATLLIFLGITLAGMIAAVVISIFLARGILRPIKKLKLGAEKLTQGDLECRIKFESKDEIGELARTFNFMAASLKDRDAKLKEYAQKKIMESERLATVGQLAASIAHELNNPMGSILIYSNLLLEDLLEDDMQRENIKKIAAQATRCKEIVKGLLDFSRQTEPKKEPTNINELLEETLSLVENQSIFQDVNISKNLCASPPPLIVDKVQIQQVFINIVLNAAEAMEGKGALIIDTRISDDGQFMEVEFTDSSCGIPEENIERLFEPFYTTKEAGKGTGLGLAISYGYVQRHNGTIEVKTQVGKGTTFIIRLPISGEKK